MQIDWFTFIAQIINFLILLVLLRKFLYGPVLNVMKKREDLVASKLEEARLKLMEAETKATDYQDKLNRLDERKEEWLEEAKQEVEAYKKELMQAARSEVERAEEKWMNALDSDRTLFLDDLEKRSLAKIIEIVETIVSELANRDLEEQAVNRFIEMLQQTDTRHNADFARAAAEGKVEITTTFLMKESDQKRMLKLMQDIFPDEVTCHFNTDPELGFGIELRTNGWKMAWNLKAYLEELRSAFDTLFNRSRPGMLTSEITDN